MTNEVALITESTMETLEVGELRMRVAMQGTGPLVLLCHGFPELWYSWRNQLSAFSAAGYRAVAPDMRGYGGTVGPIDAAEYTILHLVGDMVELVWVLGESQAVIVGALRQRGIEDFYLQYFQTPGPAEAELEKDVAATIRRIYYSGSGDGPERTTFGRLGLGRRFLDSTVDPTTLPPWLTDADIAYYATEFRRTGFRGGLNWYRNMTRSWQLLAPWRGVVIHQPSMFIAGARDDVLKFPSSRPQIENLLISLPGLRGSHIIEGAGHWIQRERAATVNELMIGFLRTL